MQVAVSVVCGQLSFGRNMSAIAVGLFFLFFWHTEAIDLLAETHRYGLEGWALHARGQGFCCFLLPTALGSHKDWLGARPTITPTGSCGTTLDRDVEGFVGSARKG